MSRLPQREYELYYWHSGECKESNFMAQMDENGQLGEQEICVLSYAMKGRDGADHIWISSRTFTASDAADVSAVVDDVRAELDESGCELVAAVVTVVRPGADA